MAASLCGCAATAPDNRMKPSAGGDNPTGTSGVFGNTLCLNAESSAKDTYTRIESLFGKGAIEAPSDNAYSPARPHLLERDGAAGPYFVIQAIEPTDINLDGKTLAQGSDRSRTEIKIAPAKLGPQAAFQAQQGDTYIYTWRFRIDPAMRFSPSFTHIHQIKAYGGDYADPPLITFTPLAKGVMEIRHVGDRSRDAERATVIGSVSLAQVQGTWIDVREEVVFSNSAGYYKLNLRDETGAEILAIDQRNLAMWRTGADHMRPKWGIYRKHHAMLNQHREDSIYFAAFGITRGTVPATGCR